MKNSKNRRLESFEKSYIIRIKYAEKNIYCVKYFYIVNQ